VTALWGTARSAIVDSSPAPDTESERPIEVLYVCPWAHWAGHAPEALARESSALVRAGAKVSLCTFTDVPDQKPAGCVPHWKVVSGWRGSPLGFLSRALHSTPLGRGLAWFFEQFATLSLAVRLRNTMGYDVAYVRDGDPFVFIPFLLGLFFKQQNWAISLLGVGPVRSHGSIFYKFVNSRIWRPIYRWGASGNRFVFLCENEQVRDFFEKEFLDGMLRGTVRLLPGGVLKAEHHIPRREARRHLGLPQDGAVLLHFGALHQGKDIETVLEALKGVSGALLVCAGRAALSVDLAHVVKREGLESRVIIKDSYIPEAEKPFYFASADAIVLSYKRDFMQTASMLLESARFGLPAIASDVGELGELVKRYQSGLAFIAEDVESLQGALARFLGSTRDEREDMARNCERLCSDFSLDTWADQCLSILAELCEPHE